MLVAAGTLPALGYVAGPDPSTESVTASGGQTTDEAPESLLFDSATSSQRNRREARLDGSTSGKGRLISRKKGSDSNRGKAGRPNDTDSSSTTAPPAALAPTPSPTSTAATAPPPTTAKPTTTQPPTTQPPTTRPTTTQAPVPPTEATIQLPAAKPRSTADPIDPAAVLVSVNPRKALSTQNWGQSVALGKVTNGPLPDSGLHGPAMSDGQTLRLGLTPDPRDPSRTVLQFAVEYNASGSYRDPLFHDGSRVQIAQIDRPKLPRGQTLWHTFRYMHEDFGTNGAADQQILTQYHDGDHSSGLNPYLAWMVTGSDLQIFIKYSSCEVPTKKPPCGDGKVIFSEKQTPSNTWKNVVVRSKVGADGFVQIWRDGVLIADYQGPFGYYNQTVDNDYAVLSYYHWHSYNDFDTRLPIRRVWWDWSSMVADPDNRYSVDDLYAHLAANTGLALP